MTTKEKLLELMDKWAEEEINVTAWEDTFLDSYTMYHVDDIPDFTDKQEETIERIYEKYVENEGDEDG